jgi:hypothetical protein
VTQVLLRIFLFIHEWWRDGSMEQFHLSLALGVEVEEPEEEVIGSLILCQSVHPATDVHALDQLFADAAREVRLQHLDFPETTGTVCPNIYGVWFEPDAIMGPILDPAWLAALAPPGGGEVRVARLVTRRSRDQGFA